jgi:hypothetical protein
VYFLILLKTYQRLGYPILLADVPAAIVEHIARSVGAPSPVRTGPATTRRGHASAT